MEIKLVRMGVDRGTGENIGETCTPPSPSPPHVRCALQSVQLALVSSQPMMHSLQNQWRHGVITWRMGGRGGTGKGGRGGSFQRWHGVIITRELVPGRDAVTAPPPISPSPTGASMVSRQMEHSASGDTRSASGSARLPRRAAALAAAPVGGGEGGGRGGACGGRRGRQR